MNTLAELETKKIRIENNIDLSAEGKKKAMAALQKEADNYRAAAVRDLGTSWTVLKSKMKNNIESVKEAEANAAKQWDYSRLNYMAQAVKSQVNSAASFEDVKSLYSKAMQSGDAHARRVWCEVVQENVTAKYRTGEAVVFTKQLQAELHNVLTTPELDAAKAEGTELTKQVSLLYDETQQANKYFYGGRLETNARYGQKTEFDNMAQGVRIERKIDKDLTTITTVELVE